TLGGWLAVTAGAWFVIGPSLSLTWESGAGPIGRPLLGPTRQMLELVGYFYGLGALIIALGAFAVGRFVSRPLLREEPAMVAAPAAPAVASSQPAAAGPGATPARPHGAERTRPPRFGRGRLPAARR